MPPAAGDRYFHLHIMKTAGFTTARQLGNAFPRDEAWGYTPNDEDFFTRVNSYINPRPLAHTPRKELDHYRLFSGHFPLVTRELIGSDAKVITVLRDPVDRVISLLKHCERLHPEHRGLSLEQIYEDEWYAERFFVNHAVKLFAMSLDQALEHTPVDGMDLADMPLLNRWRDDEQTVNAVEWAYLFRFVRRDGPARAMYELMGAPNTAAVLVDDAVMSSAIDALDTIDILGFYDDYPAFTRELTARLGSQIRSDVTVNAGATIEVDPELRRRIARDNDADLALYDAARRLVGRRRR